MTVCRFYLQGHCKFGDHCRNEHPGRKISSSGQNPFAPLQDSSGNRSNNNLSRAASGKETQSYPFNISKSNLTNDLLNERPQWILSSYAPGKDAPIQLFGGFPREQSFEEMRARHYQLAMQGKQNQAMQEAQSLVHNAESQMKNALEDVDGAIKYVVEGGNQHPNRIDMCKAKGNVAQQSQASKGGSQTSSFGQSSTHSAFGLPSAPTLSQSAPPNSAFDRTPGMSFGQPSFGQHSFGQPSFGQATSSAQPKPFGEMASTTPSFGQTSTLKNPFGNTQSGANPFQQTSTFSKQAASGPSPSPQQNTQFGTTSSPSNSRPFARKPSTQPAASVNVSVTAAFNPFAQSGPPKPGFLSQSGAPSASPFARAESSQPGARSVAEEQQFPVAQIQKDSSGKLRAWNGRNISYLNDEPCYRGNDGEWHRVWFPDGPPAFVNSNSLPGDIHDDSAEANYDYVKRSGHFRNGKMPLLAPKKEWCDWNM